MEHVPKFLADNQILTELLEALKLSDSADLAIAYWGANAIKTLGIDMIKGPVRILCDAYSGACNPDELSKMLAMDLDLKTRNGLHAKVVITSTSVIVGSANASANGLGQEGEEAGNLEAAALIKNQKCLENARTWFNSKWKDARKVTPEIIREIRPIWQERRRVRPAQTAKSSTLLGVLLAEPAWFVDREIRLVAYEGTDISKEARAKFEAIKRNLYHPKRLQKYDTAGEIPLYEDDGKWKISAGEYIIDYVINRKRKKALFGGLWRVRSHDAFHKAGHGSRIILCDKLRNFKGLRLRPADGTRLGRFVFKYVSNNGFKKDRNRSMLDISLDKLAQILPL